MKIFLTWDSRWIWKSIFEELAQEHDIYAVSRTWQYKFDLTKDVDKIQEKFKNIKFDVLVLNAWVWDFSEFQLGNLEKYEQIINLNLLANIQLLKKLNYDKKCKIIFIWSIISKKFLKGASVYQASKFGLRGLAGWLKKEWYKSYLINPKIVDTQFHPSDLDLQNFPQTEIKNIVNTIKNIINNLETKFEIDL